MVAVNWLLSTWAFAPRSDSSSSLFNWIGIAGTVLWEAEKISCLQSWFGVCELCTAWGDSVPAW